MRLRPPARQTAGSSPAAGMAAAAAAAAGAVGAGAAPGPRGVAAPVPVGFLDGSLGGEQRAEVAGADEYLAAAAAARGYAGGGSGTNAVAAEEGEGEEEAEATDAPSSSKPTCEEAKQAAKRERKREKARAKAERVARAAAARERRARARREGAAAQFESADDPGCGLHAASTGDVARLAELLASGWDPETTDRHGSSALCWAAGAGELRACEALLAAGAIVDAPNRTGRTPLHWAARNGKEDACALLAARGADVHAATKDGVNAFHWAVFGAHVGAADWALRVGVDRHALNRWGCSAVHWAASAGDVAMCRWLLERGLDFSLRNQQGHCGLCKAAWNGHAGLVEWMLGAEVPNVGARQLLARDRSGISPAELARLNGFAGLAARLAAAERAARAALGGAGGAPGGAEGQALGADLSHLLPPEDQLADLPDPERSSAAFSVYYRAQRIAEDEQEWEALEHELRRPSPAAVRLRDATPGSALERDLRSDPRWTRVRWAAPASVWKVTQYNYQCSPQLRRMCRGAAATGDLAFQDAAAALPVALLAPGPAQATLVLDEASASGVAAREAAAEHEGTGGALQAAHAMAFLAGGDEAVTGAVVLATSTLERAQPAAREREGMDAAAAAAAEGSATCADEAALAAAEGPSGPHVMVRTRALRETGAPHALALCACVLRAAPPSLRFDRVLCAPASTADGDLRVRPELWASWRATDCLAHHAAQLDMLECALHRCAVGGLVSYTTSSFNPVENEAVVLAALRRAGGACELAPPPSGQNDLLGLERAPGLTSWLVPDPGGLSLFRMYERWEDVAAHHRAPKGPLMRTMFPQSYGGGVHEVEEVESDVLLDCMRVLPHKIIGSGRFVALLRKLAPMPPSHARIEPAGDGDEGAGHCGAMVAEAANVCVRGSGSYEYARSYERVGEAAWWTGLCDAYGIDTSRFERDELVAMLERPHARTCVRAEFDGGAAAEDMPVRPTRLVIVSARAAATLESVGRACGGVLGVGAAVFELDLSNDDNCPGGALCADEAPRADDFSSCGWLPLQEGAALLGALCEARALCVVALGAAATVRALESLEVGAGDMPSKAAALDGALCGAGRHGGLLLRGELPPRRNAWKGEGSTDHSVCIRSTPAGTSAAGGDDSHGGAPQWLAARVRGDGVVRLRVSRAFASGVLDRIGDQGGALDDV